ncbi:MAG: NAD-dependent epimerase/dehydratase family protein [Patescibacteria group bacterium]
MKNYDNFLVTGGAGFIGSHLVKRLVRMKKNVGVIDNFSRGSMRNLAPVADKITIYNKDLTREDGLKQIFSHYNIVFNLAALNTGVDFDMGRTEVMFEQNMLLQMIPLRVAARVGNITDFIQVSSASVYSREAMEKEVPTPETADTYNPEPSKLGYALAKLMGENLAHWYATNTGLRTVIARFINVYGQNDHFDDLGHFIPMMTRKIIEADKQVVVFGSGKQKRSYIFVDDVVDALIFLLEKGQNGQVYNVDAEQEKSVAQVVKMICQILRKNPQLIFDLSKPEGSQRRLLDCSKINDLGWRAKTDFSDGLVRTVRDIKRRLSCRCPQHSTS